MARLLDNWLRGYLVYTHSQESPESFHLWTGLSVLSGTVRRKVFFHMEYFLLYPNLYTVLVAPPGRCKKSTAMRIGRGLMDEISKDHGLFFTTDSVTREQLIVDLSQSHTSDGHSSMTAFSTEFATLLTSSGPDMIVFLTDIFDSPASWSHKTKSGGINKIVAPYLNLLGATVPPDTAPKSLPVDVISSGLGSRIIFVYEDTPRVRPSRPKMSPEQREVFKLLIQDLRSIAVLNGEFTFTDEADKYYEEWYQGRIINPNPTQEPRLSGYFERKPMHVIKVAMLISAAKKDELKITLEDLKDAFDILAAAEERMPKVFTSLGRSPLAAIQEEVLDLFRSRPQVTQQEIFEKFRRDLTPEDLASIIQIARMLNIIEVKALPTGPVYVNSKLQV